MIQNCAKPAVYYEKTNSPHDATKAFGLEAIIPREAENHPVRFIFAGRRRPS
jgi:hypothetical protein